MGIHIAEFAKKVAEVKTYFNVSESDFRSYQTAISDRALDQESQAKHRLDNRGPMQGQPMQNHAVNLPDHRRGRHAIRSFRQGNVASAQ